MLAHWFNDRKLTQGNLKPYYTSTVDVKYIGRLYNDEPFDSSYTLMADYGDSIFRTKVGRVIADGPFSFRRCMWATRWRY